MLLLPDLHAGAILHHTEHLIDPLQVDLALQLKLLCKLGDAQQQLVLLSTFTLLNDRAHLLQQRIVVRVRPTGLRLDGLHQPLFEL